MTPQNQLINHKSARNKSCQRFWDGLKRWKFKKMTYLLTEPGTPDQNGFCVFKIQVYFSPQVAEPLPSAVRSGNLSVLKKRWEQQQQQQQEQPSSHRAQPQTHVSQSTGPKPAPTSQIQNQTSLKTTTFSQDEDTETSETNSSQLPDDPTDMEPSRESEGREAAAAEVPEAEKPSVPLTSLKMMFERGEADKASLISFH